MIRELDILNFQTFDAIALWEACQNSNPFMGTVSTSYRHPIGGSVNSPNNTPDFDLRLCVARSLAIFSAAIAQLWAHRPIGVGQ